MTASPGLELSSIPPALANRLLEREAWARDCLAAHAGRTFAIGVGPVVSTLSIDAAGRIAAAAPPPTPDLKLALAPLALPAFLADPRRWDEFVTADGDAALAKTLKGLAETLPWFVERAFADALGPIVGQRVADAGRWLLAFPEYATARVGESVASYLRDEAGLVAHAADGEMFTDAVTALSARADALAARVEALAARLAVHP